MSLNKQVWEIMISDLTTVTPDTSVDDLMELFKRRSIHHILVENKKGELMGIISTEDINRIYQFLPSPAELQAQYIMTTDPVTIFPDTAIKEVIQIFLKNKFRALPVVGDKEVLVGIVTPYDIMQYMLNDFEKEEKKKLFNT